MKQAILKLASLGFHMGVDNTPNNFGTQPAEPFYPVDAKEWKPIFRHVFIGKCVNGFYVTSHIKSYIRRKYERCQPHEAEFKNIFGGGSTLQEAIDTFVTNFKAKTYNERTI
jgi:hypothetical protein